METAIRIKAAISRNRMISAFLSRFLSDMLAKKQGTGDGGNRNHRDDNTNHTALNAAFGLQELRQPGNDHIIGIAGCEIEKVTGNQGKTEYGTFGLFDRLNAPPGISGSDSFGTRRHLTGFNNGEDKPQNQEYQEGRRKPAPWSARATPVFSPGNSNRSSENHAESRAAIDNGGLQTFLFRRYMLRSKRVSRSIVSATADTGQQGADINQHNRLGEGNAEKRRRQKE